jgi:4-hydroxy-tetrahydrodipicolinate reductase
MLLAEIAAREECALAGGCAKPGSGYINQDIGELAGVGRLGIPVGDNGARRFDGLRAVSRSSGRPI